MYGLYISDDILVRSKYEWFTRQSKEQILGNDNNIAKKYIKLLPIVSNIEIN